MGIPGIAVQPVAKGNSESAVRFLIEWVSDGEAEARSYLADHAEPEGASLVAVHGLDVVGYVAIVWESNYAGFRSRSIPLVHRLSDYTGGAAMYLTAGAHARARGRCARGCW